VREGGRENAEGKGEKKREGEATLEKIRQQKSGVCGRSIKLR
jgi:hypothetical protein